MNLFLTWYRLTIVSLELNNNKNKATHSLTPKQYSQSSAHFLIIWRRRGSRYDYNVLDFIGNDTLFLNRNPPLSWILFFEMRSLEEHGLWTRPKHPTHFIIIYLFDGLFYPFLEQIVPCMELPCYNISSVRYRVMRIMHVIDSLNQSEA